MSLWFKYKFNAEARADFYEALANFTADGIPLFDCLQDMHAALHAQKSFLAPMLMTVMGRMRGRERGIAMDLGQALGGFCPEAETAMIAAGEQAGQLPQGLRKAQHMALQKKRLQAEIAGVMVQPVVYILMIGGLLSALSLGILPAMEKGAPRAGWPVYAQWLGNLADKTGWLAIVVALCVTGWIAAFVTLAPRLVGGARDGLERMVFPFGLYRRINDSVMLLTLASMIRVGLPFETALESIQRRSNDYMRSRLGIVRGALKRGQGPGQGLAQSIGDSTMRWQIAMYAKTSAFAHGLEKLADRSIDQLIKDTKGQFRIVGLCVLTFVALMILWVLGSFFGVSMSIRASRM